MWKLMLCIRNHNLQENVREESDTKNVTVINKLNLEQVSVYMQVSRI